jgi:hypothetical protein
MALKNADLDFRDLMAQNQANGPCTPQLTENTPPARHRALEGSFILGMLVLCVGLLFGTASADPIPAAPNVGNDSSDIEESQQGPGGACLSNPSSVNCDGKDPSAEGCTAGAMTVEQEDIINVNGSSFTKLGTLKLRYSPACKTLWAKVTAAYINTDVEAGVLRNNGLFLVSKGQNKVRSPMLYAACFTGLGVEGTGQASLGFAAGYTFTRFYCIQ